MSRQIIQPVAICVFRVHLLPLSALKTFLYYAADRLWQAPDGHALVRSSRSKLAKSGRGASNCGPGENAGNTNTDALTEPAA
jgi:hypothetical protein